MTRDILFRGKRIDNGEWVEGYYVSTRAAEHIIIPLGTQWCGGAEFDKGYLVDPDTVGQYTGLKDKNGKRIFEGDILQNYGILENCGHGCIVRYGKRNCDCCEGVYGWYFDGGDIRDPECYEVIGNVHDAEMIGGNDGKLQ